MDSKRRLLILLAIILLGVGFSCRAQVLENNLFYFENPRSLYMEVGGLLSSSQAKYSMVVGKKDNAIPIMEYVRQYSSFGKNARVKEHDLPMVDYYFRNRSKVYIVAWKGQERRTELVDKIYRDHRVTLCSEANMQINGKLVLSVADVEIEEKVDFMGDTAALHRMLTMKLSQSILSAIFPPVDFYYDLYQYYDKKADITVVALFYRVEINPNMRNNFPEERSDSIRLDFEKYFKLKPNVVAGVDSIQVIEPPKFGPPDNPRPKQGGETEPEVPLESPEIQIPEPNQPPSLKRSPQTAICIPVGGEVIQFAENNRSIYILYKRGPLLMVDKQTGTHKEVVNDFAVTGVTTNNKGQLFLYVTHRGVIRWNGKSIETSSVIYKYDGGTGYGYNAKLGMAPTGDLLVYGGTSVPALLLSCEGRLLASSEALNGDHLLMTPDGMVWASTRSSIVSGNFSGLPIKHSYGDEWSNTLSNISNMCLHGNDVLACGNSLFIYQNGEWKTLYSSKVGYLSYVVVDKQGNIWLAPTDGLMYMGTDGTTPVKTVNSLNTPEGQKELTYNKGLYADANGNIWIVTGRETIVYNPDGLVGLLP